jgi:flagellar motility protein MotE (MotC chaperone)
MKLQVSRLLIGLLVVSFIVISGANSFSKEDSQNMSDIAAKMNDLKSMEKIIDDKINLLESEKKKIDNQRNALEKERLATDKYIKDKKSQIDSYIAQKQKELESLKKQIATERIKKLSAIYANAKPQAAANDLSKMNEDVAAQILVFMQPRKAGAIISKMDPLKASKIFQKFLSKQKTANKQ